MRIRTTESLKKVEKKQQFVNKCQISVISLIKEGGGEGKVNSYKNKACFCELFVTIQLKSLY